MDIVAKRQQQANNLLKDAARDRSEAAKTRLEADKALATIAARHEELIAAAHAEAQAEKQNLLAQALQEIAKLRAEANTAIVHDQAAAEAQIVARAADLSVEIARRLLARFPHRSLLDAFLEEICAKICSLPAEARDSFAGAAKTGHQIEIVTAAPLSADETKNVRAALDSAFGGELPAVFRSVPAIIAGIEIHGPTTIIRNSWAADLDRIRQELKL